MLLKIAKWAGILILGMIVTYIALQIVAFVALMSLFIIYGGY